MLLGIISCGSKKNTSEYSTTKEGLQFKLITIGEENKKAEAGNFLRLSVEYRTAKDSLFWKSSNQTPLGYFLPVTDNEKTGNFSDYFTEINQGDSVNFKVRTSLFFTKVFATPIPQFCLNDEFVNVNLKVIMIHTADEYELIQQEQEIERKRLKDEEESKIDEYVSKNMKEPIQLGSGFYAEWSNIKEGNSPKSKDKVWIRYKGYFLNGTLVDYTKDDKVFEYRVGEQFQLIQGLETVILKMKKGETAKIILPSRLAFGEQGSSNGLIPPNTPLVYEISIENIISENLK